MNSSHCRSLGRAFAAPGRISALDWLPYPIARRPRPGLLATPEGGDRLAALQLCQERSQGSSWFSQSCPSRRGMIEITGIL